MVAKVTRSSEDIARVTSLYMEGYATRKVAELLDMSPTIVAKIVKDAGLSRDRVAASIVSKSRANAVSSNWSFFPLTPEKAWLLGLIYGDGSLSKQECTITITSGDRDIIDNINLLFGNKLHATNYTNWQTIQINSMRLWKELNETFGLTPHKSSNLIYPLIEPLVKHHFVRGLIDSDGCWYLDRRSVQPRLMFQYLSLSKAFVEHLRDDFITFVGVSEGSNIQTRTLKNGYGYCVQYRNKDAIKIGEWVYAHSTSHTRGERKFSSWSQFA